MKTVFFLIHVNVQVFQNHYFVRNLVFQRSKKQHKLSIKSNENFYFFTILWHLSLKCHIWFQILVGKYRDPLFKLHLPEVRPETLIKGALEIFVQRYPLSEFSQTHLIVCSVFFKNDSSNHFYLIVKGLRKNSILLLLFFISQNARYISRIFVLIIHYHRLRLNAVFERWPSEFARLTHWILMDHCVESVQIAFMVETKSLVSLNVFEDAANHFDFCLRVVVKHFLELFQLYVSIVIQIEQIEKSFYFHFLSLF